MSELTLDQFIAEAERALAELDRLHTEVEKLSLECRLAVSARDYANDMLGKARAEVEQDRISIKALEEDNIRLRAEYHRLRAALEEKR